ncbi:hypothetical protein [Kineosporia succinea]|uniref:WG repeat protein n=1 Tax=Kineosporia succinea TaxID=84632 RepID=A0ABT9P569_9ACTN|nr:hypothetical protein [Kineosporia succinea]MDP9827827.1 hypothetical protein [Kineosporia succinea]
MSALDDRLRDALHDLDARVASATGRVPQAPPPRARRVRVLVPVLAAVAVLAVLLGSVVIGRPHDRSAPANPRPTTSAGDLDGLVNIDQESGAPSQSPADATRDGVFPAVAALPLVNRLATIQGMGAIVTDEGVWVMTRPSLGSIWGSDGCVERTDATPRYPLCRSLVYKELLLLSKGPAEQHILRAYPLLNAEDWFAVTDQAVYCGHDSNRSHYDSTVCRVDRLTLELEGLWLACGPGDACPESGTSPQMSRRPGTWKYGPFVDGAAGIELTAQGGVNLVDRYGRLTAELGTHPFSARERLGS